MSNPLTPCPAGFQSATISYDTVSRSLFTPAWTVTNLEEIWTVVFRGRDFTVSGADGVTPRRRVRDSLDVSLRMMFSGWADRHGTEVVCGGASLLAANRRDFVQAVVEPSVAADSTRTLTVVEDDGVASSALIHVEEFTWRAAGARGLARAVLDISVPAGRLAPTA